MKNKMTLMMMAMNVIVGLYTFIYLFMMPGNINYVVMVAVTSLGSMVVYLAYLLDQQKKFSDEFMGAYIKSMQEQKATEHQAIAEMVIGMLNNKIPIEQIPYGIPGVPAERVQAIINDLINQKIIKIITPEARTVFPEDKVKLSEIVPKIESPVQEPTGAEPEKVKGKKKAK